VSITKVVVFFTRNLEKLSLKFSKIEFEIFRIFFDFLEKLQVQPVRNFPKVVVFYTIEVSLFRIDP
jgi:hypothetical protein